MASEPSSWREVCSALVVDSLAVNHPNYRKTNILGIKASNHNVVHVNLSIGMAVHE